MKLCLITAALLLCCIFNLKAQSSSATSSNSAISPAGKATALSALLSLSADQVQRLSEVYALEQTQLYSEQSASSSSTAISQAQTGLAAKFQAVLSGEQLAVYSAKYPYSYWAVKASAAPVLRGKH